MKRRVFILCGLSLTMLLAIVVVWALWLRSDVKDVTNDPSFGDFQAVVGTWKAKVPLPLVEIEGDLHVLAGDYAISGSKDLGVLPIGTEIRIERLLYRETISTNFLDPVGHLVSGPYAGKQLAIDDELFAPGTVFNATFWNGSSQVTGMTWAVASDKLTK